MRNLHTPPLKSITILQEIFLSSGSEALGLLGIG